MVDRPIFILNGANLDLVGTREPGHYGDMTLADIERACRARADGLGFGIDFRQTNSEGELVGWIHEAEGAAGLVLNAGAYTHTSIAIHDALRALTRPSVEVHLSNIFAREPFRHHSYVAPVVRGSICGLGAKGYELAIEAVAALVGAERAG